MPTYQIEHIALSVSNLDRSIEWYCANFGFEEEGRSDKPALKVKIARLRLGNLWVEVFEPYERRPLPEGEDVLGTSLQRLGTKHMALLVDDIRAAREQLLAHGADLETDLTEGSTSSYLFCRDPDGILIEVIQR